jgi:bacillithiol biosynthesis deacetylase BshB1
MRPDVFFFLWKKPMLPLDILVVAAHPDDAEISVGGTIVTSRRQNLRVGILDLTSGEPTPHGSPELRKTETENATRVLDVTWRENLGLPNRSLQPTLEARRRLAEVFRLTRPRMILAHYWQDVHPDHVAASTLCDDARFWAKLSRTDLAGEPWWPPRLLHYLSIHLRIHLSPSVVVDVSDAMERKMEAVDCYASQLKTGRGDSYPSVLDNIRDHARYWGWSIGTAFGEPLFNREAVGVKSLNDLL